MKCVICQHEREFSFKAKVLGKHEVSYFYCPHCGLLQTEPPFWLKEAYLCPIADADTGLVRRNIDLSRVLACLLFFYFDRTGKYLDVAGGHGLFTRLMRDWGFDFYWSDKYCNNIFARGFDFVSTAQRFSAVTAFEVLEHVHDPLKFLTESLERAGTRTIFVTTELFSGRPPPASAWWYYAFNTGQHISFYQAKTLAFLAKGLGLNLYSRGNFHLLTDKKIDHRIFRLLVSRLSHLVLWYVRKRMVPKTRSDSERFLS